MFEAYIECGDRCDDGDAIAAKFNWSSKNKQEMASQAITAADILIKFYRWPKQTKTKSKRIRDLRRNLLKSLPISINRTNKRQTNNSTLRLSVSPNVGIARLSRIRRNFAERRWHLQIHTHTQKIRIVRFYQSLGLIQSRRHSTLFRRCSVQIETKQNEPERNEHRSRWLE